MQKAKVAGAPKTLRQHMLQDQPQELRPGNGPPLQPLAPGVAIHEAHLAIATGHDILLPDDAPVEVASQVDERLLPATDRGTVDHPLLGVANRQRPSGRFEAGQHLRPEDLRQGLMAEEIALLRRALGPPSLLPAVDRCRRHHQMNVRVILQLARVRMQNSDRPRGALQLPVVLTEGAHRLPTAAQEQIVGLALMCPGQCPEFGRQSEGQQEVLGGNLFPQLPLQPLLTLVVLTVWAVAVTAGMWNQRLVVAFGAMKLHLRAGLGAAGPDRLERLQVVGPEPVPVLRQEFGFEGVDDRRQADHLTAPQARAKPSISPLIRSRA